MDLVVHSCTLPYPTVQCRYLSPLPLNFAYCTQFAFRNMIHLLKSCNLFDPILLHIKVLVSGIFYLTSLCFGTHFLIVFRSF